MMNTPVNPSFPYMKKAFLGCTLFVWCDCHTCISGSHGCVPQKHSAQAAYLFNLTFCTSTEALVEVHLPLKLNHHICNQFKCYIWSHVLPLFFHKPIFVCKMYQHNDLLYCSDIPPLTIRCWINWHTYWWMSASKADFATNSLYEW